MQKHTHFDEAKYKRMVILLVLAVLALATIAVLYLKTLNQIEDYSSGEGSILKSYQLQNVKGTTVNGLSGEMN